MARPRSLRQLAMELAGPVEMLLPSTKRKQDEATGDSERKAKRFRDCDYNNTISVLVGEKKKLFTVHKDLICASSKFFKAACSERWVEGKEKKVSLPEVEPEVFQNYVAWLYSGIYQLQACKENTGAVLDSGLDAVVDLYILGDVLDDICLRNKMMEIQACHDRQIPKVRTLNRLWKLTPPNSLIKKMYIEKLVQCVSREAFAKNLSHYPVELVQGVALSSLKRLETKNVKDFNAELDTFLELVPEDT